MSDKRTQASPDVLAGALTVTGWSLEALEDVRSVWSYGSAAVAVPAKSSYRGYDATVTEIVRIARDVMPTLEFRALRAALRYPEFDQLRFRAETIGEDGFLDLADGLDFIAGIKKVVTAAARSQAPGRRSVYHRGGQPYVDRYLDRSKLAPTETGSFVAVVFTEIGALDVSSEPELEHDGGLERRVNETVIEGVGRLQAIVEESSRTAEVTRRVLEGTRYGLSAELCDGAASVASAGPTVTITATPSPLGPAWKSFIPRSATIDRSSANSLRRASAELRSSPTSQVTLEGRVERLFDPDRDTQWGSVTIRTRDGGQLYRCQLDASRVRQAAEAVMKGDMVRVHGVLRTEGTVRWIYDVTEFERVERMV